MTKTYTFKNTSQQEIEEGSVLSRVEGDNIPLRSKKIARISAGEVYEVNIDVEAPR
jgi:hypothetical protein